MEWLAENWLWAGGISLTILFIYSFTRPGRSTGQNRKVSSSNKRIQMSPEVIDGYFGRYGWRYQRTVGTAMWQTGWRSAVSLFPIFVKMTRYWIYFTIVPFVPTPQNSQCAERVQRHLLRLNRDINMAKFCIDSDGDVVLTVELPCANLDYEEFADAIKSLCQIADDTYAEVARLATNPGAPSRYDGFVFAR